MSRPDPIQYAERLYAAIRTANFSPMSFLAFGNAVKDGVELRRIPRIAAEPFMRVVGEMLDLEEEASGEEVIEAVIADAPPAPPAQTVPPTSGGVTDLTPAADRREPE
jgi:hypothetical protein